jgi:predicted secreted Zn-dependent protease
MRVLCTLVLALVTTPLAAKVVDDLRYSSYEVHYRDRVPLKVLLARSTPMHNGGRGVIVVGWTVPNITWRLQLETPADGRCHVRSVKTLLQTTITLPASKDTEISDNGDFRVFLMRVKAHELGHYDIARTAAFEIDRALSRLPPADHCAVLRRKADQLGGTMVRDMQRKQQTYDASNQHGMSYGDAL